MCWEQVQWNQVLVGVLIGAIISWIPGGAKMIIKTIRLYLQRRAKAQIVREVESNPNIPQDERDKAIYDKCAAFRDRKGWVEGGPFDPQIDRWKPPLLMEEDDAFHTGGR